MINVSFPPKPEPLHPEAMKKSARCLDSFPEAVPDCFPAATCPIHPGSSSYDSIGHLSASVHFTWRQAFSAGTQQCSVVSSRWTGKQLRAARSFNGVRLHWLTWVLCCARGTLPNGCVTFRSVYSLTWVMCGWVYFPFRAVLSPFSKFYLYSHWIEMIQKIPAMYFL